MLFWKDKKNKAGGRGIYAVSAGLLLTMRGLSGFLQFRSQQPFQLCGVAAKIVRLAAVRTGFIQGGGRADVADAAVRADRAVLMEKQTLHPVHNLLPGGNKTRLKYIRAWERQHDAWAELTLPVDGEGALPRQTGGAERALCLRVLGGKPGSGINILNL